MNTKKLLLLTGLIMLIAAGTTMILFSQYKIKAGITIPIKIQVSDKIGFTTQTDILHFGESRPGDTLARIIEIKNPSNTPVNAYFFVHGKVKDWIKKEPIYLNNNESKNVTISAKIPENTQKGAYEGVLRIIFKA